MKYLSNEKLLLELTTANDEAERIVRIWMDTPFGSDEANRRYDEWKAAVERAGQLLAEGRRRGIVDPMRYDLSVVQRSIELAPPKTITRAA